MMADIQRKDNLISLFDHTASVNESLIAVKGRDFSYTYKEFRNLTCHCASLLKKNNVQQGAFVGIYMERSAQMLIAIFAALRSGAAYVPSEPGSPKKRILDTFKDCAVQVVLTTSDKAEYIQNLGFRPLVPDLTLIQNPENIINEATENSNAYVLFTSGSTGKPKGVVVEHSSVLNLINYMQMQYPLNQGDSVLFKSPYTFDGSVWELFGWFSMGGKLYISEPGDEKDPSQLLKIIENENINFLFFVPSMLTSFLDYFAFANKKHALYSLKWVSVGGEVLSTSLVKRFYQLAGTEKAKLINVYGPTETTVYATTFLCDTEVLYEKIPIGSPVSNNEVYILDDAFNRVAQGQEGEICIAGAGLAKGYINNKQLSDEKFIPNTIRGKGKMYRTGDIGKQLDNGLFDFIGRKDFQVKLRGLRIEMGEIEYALMMIPEISECVVVFTKDKHMDDCLLAYIKLQKFPDTAPENNYFLADNDFISFIKQQLSDALPQYMIPSYFILCRSFPLTAHGKIDRKALMHISELSDYQEEISFIPQSDTESALYEIWKQLLGRKAIPPDESFFEAGGHSIKAIQLIIEIKKHFNTDILLKDLYDDMSLSKMAIFLEKNAPEKTKTTVSESKERSGQLENIYPITPVQSEMWTMNSFDSSGIIHNIQIEFELQGKINLPFFNQCLEKLIHSEEIFRSVFPSYEGKPVQKVLEKALIDVPFIDLSEWDEKAKEKKYWEIIRDNGNIRFSLEKLPLFSFVMIKYDLQNYRLLLAIHHLIFDGWSLFLFMKKLRKALLGIEFDFPKYKNGDYALYQNKKYKEGHWKQDFAFWEETLKAIPDRLLLPVKTDADINKLSIYGERFWWEIDKKSTLLIDDATKNLKITPFVVFMGAFQLVLASASGQYDIVVGTPYANRQDPMVAELIGYYTNMLSIRSKVPFGTGIRDFLNRLYRNSIQAFSHASLPFGDLSKLLKKGFTLGTNPIFQSIFVMQNWPHEDIELPDVSLKQKEIGNNTSKADLLLNVEKTDDTYTCWIEYNTELFDQPFIEQISLGINETLKQIAVDPDQYTENIYHHLWDNVFQMERGHTCFVIGNGGLALACIEILKNTSFSVLAIVSSDKAILDSAAQMGIPVYDNPKRLLPYKHVDYIFSINNSFILKNEILSMAGSMSVNYHDAPLPRYAGMYAPNWAIINAEKKHGVTWHKILEMIDAGDILCAETVPVLDTDTASALNTRCFEAAIRTFRKMIQGILDNTLDIQPQNLDQRSYYALAERPASFGMIDPDKDIRETEALLRACNYGNHYANEFLSASMLTENQLFYLFNASVIDKQHSYKSGILVEHDGKQYITCRNGLIDPTHIYNNKGEMIPLGDIFQKGTALSVPDPFLAESAAAYFKKTAGHELFWKEQLLDIEFLPWPEIHILSKSLYQKISVAKDFLDKVQLLFPEEKAEDILLALLFIYFLRLSEKRSASLAFVPTDLPAKIKECKPFFNPWLPLQAQIGENTSMREGIQQILKKIKKAERSETFSTSLRIRYPELRNNAETQPALIFSKTRDALSELQSKSALVVLAKDSLELHIPDQKVFQGLEVIAASFSSFLNNALEAMDSPLIQIALLSDQKALESEKILNRHLCDPLPVDDVISQFLACSEKYSDNTAIFDSGQSYSYSHFARDMHQMASILEEKGMGTEKVVGVMIGRKYEFFVSIMAILHCEACFLPLDPDLPPKRQEFFCKDAGVSLIITDKQEFTSPENIPVLNLSHRADQSNKTEKKAPKEYNPESTAYIIYTSGTSGIPKGVKISRKALKTFISAALSLYKIQAEDHILQFSHLGFDACIEEIFCSFCSGASLYLRNEEMLMPEVLLSFTREHQISIWDLPTAFWRQLLKSEYYQNTSLSSALRLLILGGEAIKAEDISIWKDSKPRHQLFNSYGPTETTVVALACEIKDSYEDWKSIPIGRPLPGYKAYIVNAEKKLLPPGMMGELIICGDALASAYVNPKENQDKAFIEFTLYDHAERQKAYCTGDLVVSDETGLVFFKGRKDDQVKIRGFRVEPGEVERQILAMEGVESCAVLVRENTQTEKSLLAFVKTDNATNIEEKINAELGETLPKYMIPEKIIRIDEIPLTQSGKTDKKKLLLLADSSMEKKPSQKAMPQSENEKFIHRLWKSILNKEMIGIDDDFFDMGGHSLKAVQLMAEIKKIKDISIPLASLIQNSSIRKFAALLDTDTTDKYLQCLVPIRQNGNKTPVFLIHGAGLNVLLYQSLSKYLQSDRAIYALQAKGLDGTVEISRSIEEMADDYIEEIRKISPEDPYILLGFSLGGFIAYDMAKKLTQKGYEVIFTGLIDSVSSMADSVQSPSVQVRNKVKNTFFKPAFTIYLISKYILQGNKAMLKTKMRNFNTFFTLFLSRLGLKKLEEGKVVHTDGVPQYISTNVQIIMWQALHKYKLIPAPIIIDLFKAGEQTFYIPERKDYGWKKFAQKGVHIHIMPGEHSQIFGKENSRYFAQILDQRLETIEKNQKISYEKV
jgi:amino acid adenylation domain-containing protein